MNDFIPGFIVAAAIAVIVLLGFAINEGDNQRHACHAAGGTIVKIQDVSECADPKTIVLIKVPHD